jgi:hypothetical protein
MKLQNGEIQIEDSNVPIESEGLFNFFSSNAKAVENALEDAITIPPLSPMSQLSITPIVIPSYLLVIFI